MYVKSEFIDELDVNKMRVESRTTKYVMIDFFIWMFWYTSHNTICCAASEFTILFKPHIGS